jgi:hypothetical protein
MSDMTFDAHSAFIGPTHRKRLRCNCTMIFMPVRKDTKKWGGLPPRKLANPLKKLNGALSRFGVSEYGNKKVSENGPT